MNHPLGSVFLAHLHGDGWVQVECLRVGRKSVGGSLRFACLVGNGRFHFKSITLSDLPGLKSLCHFTFQMDVDGKATLRIKPNSVGLQHFVRIQIATQAVISF